MNKNEQQFCTELGAWLKTTNHPNSMLIECKYVANRKYFNPDSIRKSQAAALNRLMFGMPLVHKISDGAVGSKLVDMIYISAQLTPVRPFVAVSFGKSKKAYLIPWIFIYERSKFYITETELAPFKIW